MASVQYTINNPAANTRYNAPSAYWVVPNSGSSYSVDVTAYDSSGNKKVVSSVTAYTHDQTSNTDKTSYTQNSGVGATTTTTSTNGSDVFTGGGKIGSNTGVAKIVITMTYSGHVYDQPPNAPSNMSPASGSTVNTLTPTFSGVFSDPTAGDTLAQYEIVVNNAINGGGSQLWDSGQVAASSTEIANGAFSRVYAGSALAFASSYSWRARMANNNGNWGAWSGWVNFSTVQGPDTPTNVTPSGLQASLTPAFSFTYHSPTGVACGSYRYIIKAASGGATIYDSGNISNGSASGATVSGTIAGAANLAYGGSYIFYVSVKDANGASSSTTAQPFQVAAQPVAAPTSPVNNTTVNSTTPTFAWSYTDANYAQAKYQVQIYNASTGALIKDTGLVASASHSYTLSGTTIAFGTSIRWHVLVQDSAGINSNTSADAFAFVNNAPVVSITAPTNLGTVTVGTPTITWTYTASAGGYAQASAQIIIQDSNGVTIATYTQAGAGASFSLPAGVVTNSKTYKVQVQVTDTNAGVGSSSLVTFTVAYTPPADMQGQPLAYSKNFLANPYLNVDSGTGAAQGWTATSGGPGGPPTASYAIDPNVSTQVQQANGDGQVTGAQLITITGGVTASGQYANIRQTIHCATAGFVPGSTRFSAIVQAIVSGTIRATLTINFIDQSNNYISSAAGPLQADTGGNALTLFGPQNVTIPLNCEHMDVSLEVHATAAGQTGSVWFWDAQLEARGNHIATDPTLSAGTSVATGWTSNVDGSSAATFTVDNTINNPGTNGTGAQKIQATADASTAGIFIARVFQDVLIATSGLVPGVDSVVLSALAKMLQSTGTPEARVLMQFYDSSSVIIGSSIQGNAITSNAAFALSATAASLIPSNCHHIRCWVGIRNNASGDLGTAWFMDAMLSKSATVVNDTAHFIAGDLGTGYSYDSNGYSVRAFLAGNVPTTQANPGNDGDPASATGGSILLTWDTSLADPAFYAYLIERRRQDQQSDDTAWLTLATITNSGVNTFQDYTAGGSTIYQYAVRQQITYNDGSSGVSANRAIVVGSVVFSPAWYLVNADDFLAGTAPLYNVRLAAIPIDRDLTYTEDAVYSKFLGRVGQARDAGPALGYKFDLSCYFNDTFGDNRALIRRMFHEMQSLNTSWYLKDPAGLVIPCALGDIKMKEVDTTSDTLMTVTIPLVQVADTLDY